MNRRRILLLLALLGISGYCAAQQAIAVVVVGQSSGVRSLSREDIAAIYLGNLSGHQTLVPLDLEESDVRDAFYQQIVGRNRNQMRAYWSRMVFTGKGTPPKVVGVAGMIGELQQSGTTIGYLPTNRITPGMRVLFTVSTNAEGT